VARTTADGFPVLSASYELHFVTLARTVIESAIESERQRVASIKRLYDVYWQSLHARATFGEQLSVLESATGWALQVRDDMAGELVAEGRRAFGQRGTAADSVQIAIPGAGLSHPPTVTDRRRRY
jgi:PucR family transcriptional regulator, purine catabolism regulatory protein